MALCVRAKNELNKCPLALAARTAVMRTAALAADDSSKSSTFVFLAGIETEDWPWADCESRIQFLRRIGFALNEV